MRKLFILVLFLIFMLSVVDGLDHCDASTAEELPLNIFASIATLSQAMVTVRVKDDDLSPVIERGDLVVAHASDLPLDFGRFYLVETKDGEFRIGRLAEENGIIRLESPNPDIAPTYIKNEDVVRRLRVFRIVRKITDDLA